MRAPRLAFIDAARGVAVILVFISHFGAVYFPHAADRDIVPWLLVHVGMIASPTFIIISGALLGFLSHHAGQEFSRIQSKIVDRALFLLTVGHVLVLAAHVVSSHSARWLFVTDATGASMLVGALTIRRLSPAIRLYGSFAVYVLSWVVVTTWTPGTPAALLVKETLFGSITAHFYLYSFPLVPWMAVYFASTVLGEALAETGVDRAQSLLVRTGAGALGIGVLAKGVRIYLGDAVTPLTAMFSISQKTPPGPAYLFLYAGLAFGVLYGCRRLTLFAGRPAAALSSTLIRLGRTALFAFVAQYYVYFVLVARMRHPAGLGPLVLLVTISCLVAASNLWWRFDGNRLITVGYARWRARLSHLIAAPAVDAPSRQAT